MTRKSVRVVIASTLLIALCLIASAYGLLAILNGEKELQPTSVNIELEILLPGKTIQCPPRLAERLIRMILAGPRTVIEGSVDEQPDAEIRVCGTVYHWTPFGLSLQKTGYHLNWPDPFPGVLASPSNLSDEEFAIHVERALNRLSERVE